MQSIQDAQRARLAAGDSPKWGCLVTCIHMHVHAYMQKRFTLQHSRYHVRTDIKPISESVTPSLTWHTKCGAD